MDSLSPRDAPGLAISGSLPDVFTTPSLTANLVCRVLFAFIANLVCLVPLRLLYRNGELAAVIFILVVEVQNFENIINSLIWHNDDVASWWQGYGFCDVDPHIRNFGIGLFSTCLLAIMRNLAIQIGNMRASPLTKKEKTQRNIVQALIIFPMPLMLVVWTYPLASQRYIIGTLTGCSWSMSHSWPYIIFYVVCPVVTILLTTGYASKSKCREHQPTPNTIQPPTTSLMQLIFSLNNLQLTSLSSTVFIYLQYRQVSIATASALSNNPLAQARSQRARRRLYLMVVSILVPYLPISMSLAILNVQLAGGLTSFDFHAIHNHGPDELPWNTIVYLTSSNMNWAYLEMCYLPIATAVPIFVFFGMTKDAMNCYRMIFLFFGLGKVFPRLHEEYDPDARILASMSNGSQGTSTSLSKNNAASSGLHFMTSTSSNQDMPMPQRPAPAVTSLPIHNQDVHVQPIRRNPFLFRTRFNFSLPFKLSLFRLPEDNSSSAPLELLSHQPTNRSVWSDEGPRLPTPCATTTSAPQAISFAKNIDNGHSAITPALPVLHLPSTSNQANGYGEL
ncbi:pheromone A receptor domain-containing protein [Trichoderma austrokoningii]